VLQQDRTVLLEHTREPDDGIGATEPADVQGWAARVREFVSPLYG
jgi:hypothetical protein